MDLQWQYVPLESPVPIKDQTWPDGTNPLVCVKIMAYNQADYIEECISSILIQKTTFPVRVCIHDDASTDNTAQIIKKYHDKYSRLIVAEYQKINTFKHPQKKKLRKRFLESCYQGKYIAVCEGDDFWIKDFKLERQLKFLEKNERYVGCGSNYIIVDKKGNMLSVNKFQKRELDYYDSLNGKIPKTLTIMYRNIEQLLQKEIMRIRYQTGDRRKVTALSKHGKFYIFPEAMGAYRSGVGTWSTKTEYEKINQKYLGYKDTVGKVTGFKSSFLVWLRLANLKMDINVHRFKLRKSKKVVVPIYTKFFNSLTELSKFIFRIHDRLIAK